jgi:hypothetical protein
MRRQHAPQRAHLPPRFKTVVSIYFLLNRNNNKRRRTPYHNDTRVLIVILLCLTFNLQSLVTELLSIRISKDILIDICNHVKLLDKFHLSIRLFRYEKDIEYGRAGNKGYFSSKHKIIP